MQEDLDPVGKEDDDIDNDGDVDNSDEYLGNRRDAIANAEEEDEVDESGSSNISGAENYYNSSITFIRIITYGPLKYTTKNCY